MVLLATTDGHHIRYWDCLSFNNMKRYDIQNLCTATVEGNTNNKKQYTIVQTQKIQKIKGFSCQIKVSTFLFTCGAWGHLKLSHVPQILYEEKVTAEWCRDLSLRRRFKIDGQQSRIVKIGGVNIFPVVSKGEVKTVGGRVTCRGETAHDGQNMVTNEVALKEYQVLVREETFLKQEGSMESITSQTRLPCPYSNGGCATGEGTFVWMMTGEHCNLVNVRNINGETVMSTYLVDHQTKILLNRTGTTKLPPCKETYITTNYEDIFLLEGHSNKLDTAGGQDVDIDLELKISLDYEAYSLEENLRKQHGQTTQTLCQNKLEHQTDIPFPIKDDTWGMVIGSLYYTFTCQKKEAQIAELASCYQDIPLVGSPTRFVKPDTKLLVKHSPDRPCNKHFPLSIKTTEGNWIEINPHIRATQTPSVYTPEKSTFQHEDLSHGGLYSTSEMKSWEEMISFPSYANARLMSISLGDCVNQKQCDPDGQSDLESYDFTNLITEVKQYNPLQPLREWIHTNGDILALCVLILVVVKVIMDTTMILFTLAKEGPGAVLALLVELYLSNAQAFRRIRRRNAKYRNKKTTSRTRDDATTDAEDDNMIEMQDRK